MKNKNKLLVTTSILMLPLVITPIVSCSKTVHDEKYIDAYNSELGFFFNNRGIIYGYEGPNGDGTWKDQKVVTVPEYLEVTSPKTSPIYGKKYRIKEINQWGGLDSSPKTQLWEYTNLEKIILPNSIELIGSDTFGNSKLSEINWPNNLIYINNRAFSGTLLKEIEFPKSLESIGDSAFFDCKKLEKVIFPKNLESIGKSAFKNTNLKKVELPKNCKYYSDSFPPDCEVVGGKLVSE